MNRGDRDPEGRRSGDFPCRPSDDDGTISATGPDGVSAEVFKAATEFYGRKEEKLGREMMANH
jgi:hypothetical protein